MDNKILIKYRDNNQEIDLLNALEQKHLNEYDEEYKKLLEIVFAMLSITKKNQLPIQQFLFNSIFKKLSSILITKTAIEEFVELINKSINEDNDNVTAFVFRFILNIKDNIEGIGEEDNINILKGALERVNLNALHEAIANGKEYQLIVKLFYNCVTDMDANRRVLLNTEAIQVFRNYIEEEPENYLRHFIRPYYLTYSKQDIDYYLHVGEPFNNQIFSDKIIRNITFTDFLNRLDGTNIDSELLEDIRQFNRINERNLKSGIKTVVLSSPVYMPNSRSETLKIQSEKHIYTRGLCTPPYYKERENEK